MITWREIEQKAMTMEKREEARHDLFSFYVGRPLTYFLTVPFIYTNIAPNSITFVSIAMSVIGFLIICFAFTEFALVIAWLCFFMWSMFDGIDGNIARYKKQFSKLGTVYDTMGGYVAIILMFYGAGIAASHITCLFDSFIPFSKECYIIFGGLSSIFDVFPRLMMHNIISTIGNSHSLDAVKNKKNYGLIEDIALNLTSPSGGVMVLLLVAILFKLLDVFTVGYCILNFAKMIISLILMFKGVGEDEN